MTLRYSLAAALALSACATAEPPGGFELSALQVIDAVAAYQCPPEPDTADMHVSTVCAIHYRPGRCTPLPPREGLPQARCRWTDQAGRGPWRRREGVFQQDGAGAWRIDESRPQPHAGGLRRVP